MRAMEPYSKNLMERVLELTLEIIYLLTGEDDIVVKKTSGDGQNSIMVPLRSLPIPKRQNELNILEVTKKIIDLLAGEGGKLINLNVHIKEEIKEEEEEDGGFKKCLKEHGKLYEDNTIEDQMPLTSTDGFRKRNPPESHPLDSTREHHQIPRHDQKEEMFYIKTEIKEEEEDETYVCGNQQSMEEPEMMKRITMQDVSLDASSTGRHNGWIALDGRVVLSPQEITATAQHSAGGTIVTPNIHHNLNSMGRPTDELTSEESHILKPNVQPSFGNADKSPDPSNLEEPSRNISHPIHVVVYHRIPSSDKLLSCSQCEKIFLKKSELIQHQRIHTGEKPFSCPECAKTFSSKSQLTIHQRGHTDKKPFPCSECEKAFIRRAELIRHYRIHTGEKPYSCHLCGKTFTHKSQLTLHQRMHTGEKPFSCSECEKSFTHKTALIRHARIHSGEKPFTCSECEKSFMFKWQLKTHQKVHTGEKPFSCSECGKCFPSKGNLDKHRRVHTGEKPFSCPKCWKSFSQKTTLLIHLKKHTA